MRLLYCLVVFGVELGATKLPSYYSVDVIEEKNAMVVVVGGERKMSHQF